MASLHRRVAAALVLALALGSPATLRGQSDPRTAFFEQAGWDALTAGDVHAAADHFQAALNGDPRNPWLHVGAGLAAYLERRDADARSALERALALRPDLTEARALLGQVQHRAGELRSAIASLEIVVAATPEDRAARETLDRWRRENELHDRMQQAIGTHFTVSFEGPSEELLANQALASLDRAYWRIGAVLGVFPNAPIHVVLYTTEQFNDITRSPTWAAGAFDGSIRVPMRGALDNSRELNRVLAHEFTHALVRTVAARGVPAWLNEGLASALEADDMTWAAARIGAEVPLPLRRLPPTFAGLDGPQAQLAYATSAIAARRLLDENGGAAVVNLLRDLGEGVDFDQAFLHRTQRAFANWVIE